jgi:ketosteroid isomerase-like protein
MDRDELSAEQLKALDAWYDGFGSGDIAHAYSHFDENCTWSGIGTQLERVVYTGRQTIIDYQSAWVHTVWTGSMKFTPVHTLCDGNVLIAEWTDEATSAVTGEHYRNQGIHVFEFDGTTTVKRGATWFDAAPLAGPHVERFAEQGVATE